MRPLVAIGAALLALPGAAPAAAQPKPADAPQVARVREELRALIAEANVAMRRRDRAALERIYAEEYVWAHSAGYVDDRATHIDQLLALDSVTPMRILLDPPAQLLVYGDAAVLRTPARAVIAGGRPVWNATWFAKRDGRWQFVQAQGTLLQPERTAVPIAPELLNAYAGGYGENGRVTTLLQRQGAGLVARGAAGAPFPPRTLTPVSDSTFYDKLGALYTVLRAPDGRVTHLVIRNQGGQETRRERLP